MFGFLKKLFGGREKVDIFPIIERGAVILDVRSPQEFKTGHPKGAINIPLQRISQNISTIKNYNKPIIACCASGRRSGMAARQLKAAGIDAYNGGAWTYVSNLLKKKMAKRQS